MNRYKHFRAVVVSMIAFLVACGVAENEDRQFGVRSKKVLPKSQQSGEFASSLAQENKSKDNHENKDKSMVEVSQHFILVHGGAAYSVANLERFRSGMVRDGIARDRIHLLRYNHRQSLAEIGLDLEKQILDIIDSVPAGTKFDVIGHSLGDFIGLYSVVSSGLYHHVRMHIALAGVKFGQDTRPLTCRFGCSDVYDKLTPYRGDFIIDFFDQNKAAVEGIKHCAIWSSSDRMINEPSDAGAYPGGSNHRINRVGHGWFMRAAAWSLVKDRCY